MYMRLEWPDAYEIIHDRINGERHGYNKAKGSKEIRGR